MLISHALVLLMLISQVKPVQALLKYASSVKDLKNLQAIKFLKKSSYYYFLNILMK